MLWVIALVFVIGLFAGETIATIRALRVMREIDGKLKRVVEYCAELDYIFGREDVTRRDRRPN